VLACALAVVGCAPAPIEVAGFAQPDVTTNLVAYWSFDEGSGTVLHDQSGNLHDGMVGGATWIPGQFGGALHFQGGQMVTVPSFPSATESWSLSLWLYIATAETPMGPPLGPPGAANIRVLASTQNMTGGWVISAAFSPLERRFRFGYGTPNVNAVPVVASLDCNCVVLDRWTQLAVVFDATSSSLSIYEDGLLQASAPAASPISPVTPPCSWGAGPSRTTRFF
jgi:hypothetical protein